MEEPATTVSCSVWRCRGIADGKRIVPAETAIAFSYDGGTYAVMMATPQHLDDFALGFSVTEGLITSPSDIRQFEIVELPTGVELRMWLSEPHSALLRDRRRYLAGPTGCGLCGIESLDEAMRTPRQVGSGRSYAPAEIMQALESLGPHQELNRQTRAVHATAFWTPGAGLVALREDVGRHNALDKLAGALIHDGVSRAEGIVLLTSRVSVEMVQKAAAIGAPLIVAVSAPTALALRTAEAAGITLVAVARSDGFEIFTHPHRVDTGANAESVTNVA